MALVGRVLIPSFAGLSLDSDTGERGVVES